MSWLFSLFSNAPSTTTPVEKTESSVTSDVNVESSPMENDVPTVVSQEESPQKIESPPKQETEPLSSSKSSRKSKDMFLRKSADHLLSFLKSDMEEKSKFQMKSKFSMGKSINFTSNPEDNAFFEVTVDLRKEEIEVFEFCYKDQIHKQSLLVGKTNLPDGTEKKNLNGDRTRRSKILHRARQWVSNLPEYVSGCENYQQSQDRYFSYLKEMKEILS